MHSGKGAWPLSLHGWFWVKVKLRAPKLSILGSLHVRDHHARAHCIVCVCAANTVLPFSPPLSLLPFPPFEMLPQMSVKVQVSLCVCIAAVGIFSLDGAWFDSE